MSCSGGSTTAIAGNGTSIRSCHRAGGPGWRATSVGAGLGKAYHNVVDDDGAARTGLDPGVAISGADNDDAGGFGDSGRFGAVNRGGRQINWPTVLVSAAVAAVVSSLFLALGVVGLHRSNDGPAEVVVAVDPRGAVSVDGTPVEGLAGAASSSSDPAPDTTTATGGDGGGLSPATGAARAPSAAASPAPSSVPVAGDEAGSAPPQNQASEADHDPAEGDRVTGWNPPGPLPADFAVTTDDPTLDDLNAIVHLLVATPADDAAKARNLEAGMGGVVVPRTVYNLGIFRAPQGWKRITGPVERAGDTITATLHSESAGRPSIRTRVVFVKRDGNWKLSTQSVCEGVRTVGLPVSCGG